MRKGRWASIMIGILFFLQVLAVGLNLLLYQEDAYLKIQGEDRVLSSFLLEEEEIGENFEVLSGYFRFPAVLNGEVLALPHLPMSEKGRVHFYEVKCWFRAVDILFPVFCALQLLLWRMAGKRGLKLSAGWMEAAAGCLVFLAAAGAAANFPAFFSALHRVLFFNDYWQMDPFLDPVVLYLPESYFRYCGIFLAGMELAGIAVLEMVRQVKRFRAGGRRDQEQANPPGTIRGVPGHKSAAHGGAVPPHSHFNRRQKNG